MYVCTWLGLQPSVFFRRRGSGLAQQIMHVYINSTASPILFYFLLHQKVYRGQPRLTLRLHALRFRCQLGGFQFLLLLLGGRDVSLSLRPREKPSLPDRKFLHRWVPFSWGDGIGMSIDGIHYFGLFRTEAYMEETASRQHRAMRIWDKSLCVP